jgi:hypothetical protein
MQMKRLEAWLTVLDWNQRYPIGTHVTWDDRSWNGKKLYRTQSEAMVLPGDVPGVWITGHLCAVRIDQLRVFQLIAGGRVRVPKLLPTHPQTGQAGLKSLYKEGARKLPTTVHTNLPTRVRNL